MKTVISYFNRMAATITLMSLPVLAYAQNPKAGFEKQAIGKLNALSVILNNIGYAVAFACLVIGLIVALRGRGADSWGFAGKALIVGFMLSMAQLIWDWVKTV